MSDPDTKLKEAVLRSVKRGACKMVDDLLTPIGIDARAKIIADEFGVAEHGLLPQMGAAFVEQEMARLRQMAHDQMIMPIGVCGGVGENMLGKLLMQVREELRNQ